ncbi:MATE family efflux transporter [Pseudothermotoga thermarum]|uniref:MATE efflux family protein n=1 Tax=Pseudothermotoga thermarum DSM 5069 TaxID=688269 RepID=F7YWX5_9THEM|nr:MATE family efflux transporter [Pseudothermotoga thermarum]AEH50567.1 MATE efflux family protein [Pseudothermotoga thermarum DSM 5069]
MEQVTKGVQLLLGDPKKALIKLSLPMMTAMFVQALYNLVDSIWVAGLGPSALASIGVFFPIFMVIVSIATGISVGASAVISQQIGRRDKPKADEAATHSLLFALILGVTMTVVFLLLIGNILKILNLSTEVYKLSVAYARIVLSGTILLMFNNVANGILRGEGDTKRVMYAITFGSVLNIGLDPIFIYILKLGVAGAALATVLSIFSSSLLIIYWMFLKKRTFVTISFRNFKYNGKIVGEILRIGIPSSLAQLTMSIVNFVLNVFVVKVAGDFGMAVFTAAWRLIDFARIPLIGIASAVTSVVGAAYGAKDGQKLNEAHLFSIKFGELIGVGVLVLIVLFAPQLALLFTYTKEGSLIFNDLVLSMRVLSLFLPGIPFGMFTSSVFQGVGQAGKSLVVTILRTVVMQVIFCWLFAFALDLGLVGVWFGIVCGNAIGSAITFVWGRNVVKNLMKAFQSAV